MCLLDNRGIVLYILDLQYTRLLFMYMYILLVLIDLFLFTAYYKVTCELQGISHVYIMIGK